MDNKEQIAKNYDKNLITQPSFDLFLSKIDFYQTDKSFFLICKKAERLVSAIYLITDLFPENEPLALFLRKNSLEVISLITMLKSSVEKSQKDYFNNLQTGIVKLASFLEIAYMSGLISNMNFSILSDELVNLMNQNEEYVKNGSQNEKDKFKLSDEFFAYDKGQFDIKDKIEELKKESERLLYKGQNKEASEGTGIKDKKYTGHKIEKEYKQKLLSKKTPQIREKKNERQLQIIDVVKSRVSVSIKDISSNIKDCSEKTIQRELTSMVKLGVLKKEGKKRWSKYSLNL